MRKKFSDSPKNKLFSYCLIFFCITPFWIFSDLEKYKFQALIIIFIVSFFLFFFLHLAQKFNRNFYFLLIALIFFYGIDSNLGLWVIFGNLFDIGILNYLFSLFILILLIFINYRLIQSDPEKIKKIFSFTVMILFLFNFFNDYNLHSKNKKIETINFNEKSTTSNNKKKTIILLLDEMIGYDD